MTRSDGSEKALLTWYGPALLSQDLLLDDLDVFEFRQEYGWVKGHA